MNRLFWDEVFQREIWKNRQLARFRNMSTVEMFGGNRVTNKDYNLVKNNVFPQFPSHFNAFRRHNLTISIYFRKTTKKWSILPLLRKISPSKLENCRKHSQRITANYKRIQMRTFHAVYSVYSIEFIKSCSWISNICWVFEFLFVMFYIKQIKSRFFFILREPK